MSRTTRTRTRVGPFPAGSLTGLRDGVSYNLPNDGDMYWERCEDSHGMPTTDSALLISQRYRQSVEPINGHYSIGADWWATANNYYPSGVRTFNLSHPDYDSVPSVGASMTTLLARTNPSRPDYVPLTLIQDLVDIPRQLKDVGKLIRTPAKLLKPREVANQHLGFQFGWKPLFKDVQDLLDLQSHVNKRIGELQRLKTSNGIKRRIRIGRWTQNNDGFLQLESNRLFDDFRPYHRLSTKERWGTVRWLPSVPTPIWNPNDADTIEQAKNVALGLSVEGTLKGAWDLIPWTWVVNWFTNVGEFALQYSNTVPARASSANVMTRTSTRYWLDPLPKSGSFQGGGGYIDYITKERYVGPPTVDVTLPFIGKDRLSILGSLFVQRFMR